MEMNISISGSDDSESEYSCTVDRALYDLDLVLDEFYALSYDFYYLFNDMLSTDFIEYLLSCLTETPIRNIKHRIFFGKRFNRLEYLKWFNEYSYELELINIRISMFFTGSDVKDLSRFMYNFH